MENGVHCVLSKISQELMIWVEINNQTSHIKIETFLIVPNNNIVIVISIL